MKASLKILLSLVVLHACVSKITKQNVTVKSVSLNKEVKPDAEIDSLIKPYKRQLDDKMNRVIGYNKIDLVKGEGESTLGNFMVDAIWQKANELNGEKVDIAALNNGGIRTSSLAKGRVTVGNIFELMPFENEIVVLTLTGSQTYKYFAFQGQKKTHIANAKSTFLKPQNLPKTILINGLPIDTLQNYTIAMSDYMASSEPEWIKNVYRKNLNIKLRDLLIDKFEKLSAKNDTAFATIDGRMVFE